MLISKPVVEDNENKIIYDVTNNIFFMSRNFFMTKLLLIKNVVERSGTIDEVCQ